MGSSAVWIEPRELYMGLTTPLWQLREARHGSHGGLPHDSNMVNPNCIYSKEIHSCVVMNAFGFLTGRKGGPNKRIARFSMRFMRQLSPWLMWQGSLASQGIHHHNCASFVISIVVTYSHSHIVLTLHSILSFSCWLKHWSAFLAELCPGSTTSVLLKVNIKLHNIQQADNKHVIRSFG